MSRLMTTALACLLAISAAGCAIELPKSAIGGFRLAPPDGTGQNATVPPRREAPKAGAAAR